jgi:hypothetical protein
MNEVKARNEKELHAYWDSVAKKALKGKTIVDVRYLNDEEMEMMGWYSRPVCFFLNDGTSCILSSDDEGNDGGVLFYGENGVLPVL